MTKKRRWTNKDIADQSGRVAVVTGANSGIGLETARELARKGAEVIIASRSQQRGQAAVRQISTEQPRARLHFVELDLADLASVQSFPARFLEVRADARLDLLINNAGVMMPTERQETKDGFELQFGTNHLGHFALTLKLLPYLVQQPNSRVVNVASEAQNFGEFEIEDLQWSRRRFKRMPSYGASKIANMLFSLELKQRLATAGVSTIVASCHPGWTRTNLQKDTPLFRLLSPLFAMNPWQGALPTLFAATAEGVESGGYYGPDGLGKMRGYPVVNRPSTTGSNPELARRLWAQSEQWVGMQMPKLERPE